MTIEERQAIEGRTLLLFDGLCAMCNGLIRFLIRRDSARRLLYAPLESCLGREMLERNGLSSNEAPRRSPDGVVLIESALTPEQRVSQRSGAAIQTLLLLPGVWPRLGRLLSWIPRGVRERAYGFVARWRYRLFGAYRACPIPSLEERALILGTGAASGD